MHLYSIMPVAGRNGLKNQEHVKEMNDRLMEGLMYELRHNHQHDPNLFIRLSQRLGSLQDLANLHVDVLSRFKRSSGVELPALYKELFSAEA